MTEHYDPQRIQGLLLFNENALTLPVSVTSTASTSAALPEVGPVVRIVNEGPNIAFVAIGATSQTATLPNATATRTSTPVLPYSDITLRIADDAVQNISAICRSGGTATLSCQVGRGT